MIKKLPKKSEILYLQGDINYTYIHFTNGDKMMSSRTLLRYQEKLDGFIRISRKYLVNPKYTIGFVRRNNQVFLKVTNDDRLKISRRKVKAVTSQLASFV